ncbi:hypothetical protein B0H11DRAFT_2093182 [Mycena galericulata]|nr:hypothetical protein B0H11DRAFT_2093182 [Mycena galericulata]
MPSRTVPPPKKNRARCGIKYPLRIVKGDLGPDSEYLDEDLEENLPLLAVQDVDINEGNEHHLQVALATKEVFIPTPGAVRVVDNYHELYPLSKWKDPITYATTSTPVEEATSYALVHDCTYYMDERDKEWLDKINQATRGEGTSAHGARAKCHAKDKEPEMDLPVSISEDEFELVMGLLEQITDPKVLDGEGPDFSSYHHFFVKPLPADTFASYAIPTWIPPPGLLVRIARTIYPHWKQRRSLLSGRRIRPTLNCDEGNFLDESYICFRRRGDNKPVRKTRAGQVVNADKLMQLHGNLSQALDIVNALLAREQVKRVAAVQSHNVWRVRQPMADMLRRFPSLLTKADEERLLGTPRKTKVAISSPPKVKVLPSSPSPTPVGHTILPSERCAAIQQEIMESMQKESELVKSNNQVDLTDNPYQPFLTPRAEKMWVDVLPLFPAPRPHEQVVWRGSRSVRMRIGRGGRRFLDRRNSSHPYLAELRNHRRHANGGDSDEETARRLQEQWRFDADCSLFRPPEEENREPTDEFDSRYLVRRMMRLTKEEAALVTDASIPVPQPNNPDLRMIPGPFFANETHILTEPSLHGYLAGHDIVSSPSELSGGSGLGSPARPTSTPVQVQQPQLRTASPRAQAPMRPPSSLAPPRMQENISPQNGSVLSSPSTRPMVPQTHTAQPHNPNPISIVAGPGAVKSSNAQPGPVNVNGIVNVNSMHHGQSYANTQTNGARTTVPTYVPLPMGAGTNLSLKLTSSRVLRPSPLATHSVVAAQMGMYD